jgi:dye decolorizing peroxidase
MNTRKLALGLLSVVVGGGIFATATMVDLKKDSSIGSAVEPFYGLHQNGIEIDRQANATLIAFDIKDGVDKAAIARLMRLWTNDSAELAAGRAIIGDPQGEMAFNPARLTILIGYGYSLFTKVNIVNEWPIAERAIPSYSIDKLEERWSDGDLVLQITGDNPQSIFHASQVLERDAQPFATVRWQQRGFLDPAGVNKSEVSRNLMGQLDGTANKIIASKDFKEIAWAKEGALAHGTTMIVRRIRMNLDSWNKVSTASKSGVIGRSLDDGAVLESPSATAHQSRAFTQGGAGIIRRGFNYDDNYLVDGTRDAGLIFISFQAQLKNYLDIQSKLNAEDSLNRYTTPVGSALFIIPSGVAKGDYLGSQFFK